MIIVVARCDDGLKGPSYGGSKIAKVFWFFFSKKEHFFLL
jgi:hypothetical protein